MSSAAVLSSSPPGPAQPRLDGLTIFVRGLEVDAGIGVHAHEHGRLQRLVLDIELDLTPAAVERLADTLDYEAVASAAERIAAEGHIGLVETFAQRLARACMDDHRVIAARVRVEKPGALGGGAAPGCVVSCRR